MLFYVWLYPKLIVFVFAPMRCMLVHFGPYPKCAVALLASTLIMIPDMVPFLARHFKLPSPKCDTLCKGCVYRKRAVFKVRCFPWRVCCLLVFFTPR